MSEKLTNDWPSSNEEIDIRELVLVLLRNKLIVVITALLVAGVAAVYAFMSPNQYIVRTIAVAIGSGGNQNRAAGFAALVGMDLSMGVSNLNLMNYVNHIVENTAFVEKIIEQEWVVERLQTKKEIEARAPIVYDTLTLAQFWEFNEPDTTVPNWEFRHKMRQVNYLRHKKNKFITVENNSQAGTIEIKTRFENPSLSYQVHRFLIEHLRQYVEEDYLGRGKEKRIFIEDRVAEVKENLNRAEMELVRFRESNLTVQSPSIILEGERLQRDVLLQANVYAELVRQLEVARIDEKREAPTFEVVRAADLPLRPSEPNRKLLLLIGLVGGGFVGIFAVFAKEWILSIKNA